MNRTSRRAFLSKTGAAVGASAVISSLNGTWTSLAQAESPGYFEREFGVDDHLCRKALTKALSRGADFAELFFEHSTSNWLMLEDGQVNQAYTNVSLGVGIRAVKGDQVGYAYTEDLTDKAIITAATTAATIADQPAKSPAKQFIASPTSNYYPATPSLTSAPLSAKLPLVQSVNDRCFALSKEIVKVQAGLHDSQRRILIVTSEGTRTEDLQPRNFLFASAVAERGRQRERAFWNFGGRRDASYYTKELAERLARTVVDRVLVLFDAVQPPAGEMPMVLGPGVTGILLHEAIGHGMEADFNRKKISTYATLLGKKVAEPAVTIIDDATNPSLTGSLNVDDEGTPGQKTVLVDKGILVGYLHDRISARHYGVTPTGNGRRESYRHYPIPRMRNTYMLAGQASPADAIGTVKRGIYVQDVSNGQVKVGEGDFAFYVSQGRMIEDGKLTAPIKDVNIMGNGPKMLLNVAMVANDLAMNQGGAGTCGKEGQGVPVSFGLPTLLVKSMTVGGVKTQEA
jgi:TldD protein